MTELQRIRQVLAGNVSAFSHFVETYQDMAITIAHRICNNRQDAEDVVQESFVKAYHNLHSFRGDSKFSSWLYRIVYNTAVNQAKARIWMQNDDISLTEVQEESYFDTQKQIERMERTEMVQRVLNKMPKGEALILTLYYMEDNSVKEIAEIMGLNESNVKVKLFRARKSFREQMPAGCEQFLLNE